MPTTHDDRAAVAPPGRDPAATGSRAAPDTMTVTAEARARKGVYRAADTRHALITDDCGQDRLAVFVADPDARGAAALWDSPIGLLDPTAVRALRDDLVVWLEHHGGQQ